MRSIGMRGSGRAVVWMARAVLATTPFLLGASLMTPRAAAVADTAASIRDAVPKISLDDDLQVARMKQRLEADYPDMRMTVVEVNGNGVLQAEHGGMRVFWIYRGEGEVYLPKGYRTQEGGPGLMPEGYVPDPVDPAFATLLDGLKEGLPSMSERVVPHVNAILNRFQDGVFIGDMAVEMWNLEHHPRPWAGDERVEAMLVSLFDVYRQAGYSTKQAGSYERVLAGDQIIATGEEKIRVRGNFRCLALENIHRTESHISTVRRLPYLVDAAGGCSFDFDPYRRLPLTWYMDEPGMKGDGINFVNAHVVNIPRELSSTHFHPRRPPLGGVPQTEIYLVLDPKVPNLETYGRKPSILVFPDLQDLTRHAEYPLETGDFIYNWVCS